MNIIVDEIFTGRLRTRQWLKAMLLLFFLIIFFSSCKDDPDIVGISIIPDNEMLEVIFNDTSTVRIYSVLADSIKTDETSRSMLGSYLDPVFGLNTVSIATQFRISTTTLNLGQNNVLDSVVLSLEYTSAATGDKVISAYGDTSTVQTIKVFELDESLDYDTSYYSNYEIPFKPVELASADIQFRPTDSIMVDTVLVKAQLRIPLSEDFGNFLLNSATDTIASSTDFLEIMKGLYIKPEPVSSGGAIVFFDLLASASQLTLYYKDANGDSQSYPFYINTLCARYMNFNHDYSLGDPAFIAQLNGDSTLSTEQVYLQSLGGIETRISFPYINDWFENQHIVINEAKLEFYNADTASIFSPPSELFFFELNQDGTYAFLPEQFEGITYFGGIYDENTGTYFYRITQKLQKIIDGENTNPVFSMGVSGASLVPYRVVLHGTNPQNTDLSDKRIKLKLIYTKIEN